MGDDTVDCEDPELVNEDLSPSVREAIVDELIDRVQKKMEELMRNKSE